MWIDTRKFEQPGLPAICKSIETLQQVLESLGISDDQLVDTENDEVGLENDDKDSENKETK